MLRKLIIYLHYFQIAGIQLTVNSVTERYPNNSIVTNTDIGTGSAALICTTTLPGCCFSGHQETQWYFPNGSQVPNNPSLPYRRSRGQNPGRVILSRNSESTITGIFHCTIPDASGVTQSFFVGIYTATTGESCTLSEYNWLSARTDLAVQTIHFKYLAYHYGMLQAEVFRRWWEFCTWH